MTTDSRVGTHARSNTHTNRLRGPSPSGGLPPRAAAGSGSESDGSHQAGAGRHARTAIWARCTCTQHAAGCRLRPSACRAGRCGQVRVTDRITGHMSNQLPENSVICGVRCVRAGRQSRPRARQQAANDIYLSSAQKSKPACT